MTDEIDQINMFSVFGDSRWLQINI